MRSGIPHTAAGYLEDHAACVVFVPARDDGALGVCGGGFDARRIALVQSYSIISCFGGCKVKFFLYREREMYIKNLLSRHVAVTENDKVHF